MQIEKTVNGELLELKLAGPLDNNSSIHFQHSIDDLIRDGWHRILVRMGDVNYLSSAGIGALIATQKRLGQLHGFFGICHLTAEVERTLRQTRLLEALLCDPDQIRAQATVGSQTLSFNARISGDDALAMEIYEFEGSSGVKCTVFGDPAALFAASNDVSDSRSVEFSTDSFGLGFGALGSNIADSKSRCGEFLSIAGNVALSGPNLPDYSLTQGEFRPSVQALYGMQCRGSFSHFVRFELSSAAHRASLSQVVTLILQELNQPLAGLVILAESAGLVGARPRISPFALTGDGVDRFEIPAIREWMSYSPERVHARHLALLTGVATRNDRPTNRKLESMLRPLDVSGDLQGHFHSAVFPYRPFKKRTLDYETTVNGLFESGSIQDVLHLLSDYRPQSGVGESEFLAGACWIAPITEIDGED